MDCGALCVFWLVELGVGSSCANQREPGAELLVQSKQDNSGMNRAGSKRSLERACMLLKNSVHRLVQCRSIAILNRTGLTERGVIESGYYALYLS